MELITIVVLLILITILYKYLDKTKRIMKIYQEDTFKLMGKMDDKRKEIGKLENIIKVNKISEKNIIDAIEFYNKIESKKYLKLYEIKDKSYSDIRQRIAIVMYENDITYKMDYYKKLITPSEYEKDNIFYKNYIKFECVVFVDGEKDYPLLLSSISSGENKSIEIEDINLNNRKSRGIGTVLITFLNEILPNYNINKIVAKVSTVDYHVKDRLMRFYCEKNGFKIITELTENKWGKLIKEIKQ
ncbi:hypothetical protein PMY38_09330 [Clostridium tertium]|uniref:hypothetical protein n=1 Tax=Clostridium tertium TaxID=1559 RepID=UPI0023313B36|nr:hypothetical protein [Clostridium tertium]MDB1956496.1 hypothetical protein [Clostridium tertium]MDB1958797.1 hypothetical protein [Clostridium tertium]MDB1962336.1 hypothetical protein [Clostridium tertium]MDB1967580.1 hypothetical protein [Clostridium tertium]